MTESTSNEKIDSTPSKPPSQASAPTADTQDIEKKSVPTPTENSLLSIQTASFETVKEVTNVDPDDYKELIETYTDYAKKRASLHVLGQEPKRIPRAQPQVEGDGSDRSRDADSSS